MSQTTFVCPLCGARFHHPRAATLIGRKARCGKCNQVFIVKELEGPRDAQGVSDAVTQPGAAPAAGDPRHSGGGRPMEGDVSGGPEAPGGSAVAVATATEPATPAPAVARSRIMYLALAVAGLALLGGILYITLGRSSNSALATVRAYLAAGSWRDRLDYVLEPEVVKPLMEARYSGSPWKVPKFEMLTATEPQPDAGGWVTVEADVSGDTMQYYLKKVENGYRIDWKMSMGINDVSSQEFHATRPTMPTRMHAFAQLTDSFLDDYYDLRNSAWSINLVEEGGGFIATGYAMKNTPTGDRLFATLKDGQKHRVVVDVQCRPGSKSGDRCMITKVLRIGSWRLEIEEPATGPAQSTGSTATTVTLLDAAEKGEVEQVRLILKQRADVNGKDKAGRTALHRAALRGHKEVAAVLIDAGADVNAKDTNGHTPLLMATGENHVAIIQLLVSKGADVNSQDNIVGWTALHQAAGKGYVDTASFLVDHGAKLDIKDKMGLTAADNARLGRHAQLAEALAQLMEKQGSQPRLRRSVPQGSGDAASTGGVRGSVESRQSLNDMVRLGLIQQLDQALASGVDLDAVDGNGFTLLRSAALYNQKEIASLLIARGASIDAQDPIGGMTALHMAMMNGYEEMAELLLDKGADPNIKNKVGWTAMHWAKGRMVEVLKSHGGNY